MRRGRGGNSQGSTGTQRYTRQHGHKTGKMQPRNTPDNTHTTSSFSRLIQTQTTTRVSNNWKSGSARSGGYEMNGKLWIGHDRGEASPDIMINGRGQTTRSEERSELVGLSIVLMGEISVREITKAQREQQKNGNRKGERSDERVATPGLHEESK